MTWREYNLHDFAQNQHTWVEIVPFCEYNEQQFVQIKWFKNWSYQKKCSKTTSILIEKTQEDSGNF